MRRWFVVVATLAAVAACIALIETRTAFRAARVVEYLAIFVLAAVAAWAARGGWRNAFVMVCSLVFGLAVLEGVVMLIAKPKTETRSLASFDDSGLNGARPLVGWGPSRPGRFRVVKKDEAGRTIYDAEVTIDASLNRLTRPAGPRPIVFFGDSFVFGDGVNDGETLPQAFSDLEGGRIPVLNLAFSGWSPAQNLAALQQGLYRPLLDRPRHFILFTSAFHIERTACKGAWSSGTAPRFALVDGHLAYKGPCAGRLWSRFVHAAEGFALYRRIAAYFAVPTRKDAELYRAIVTAFVAEARKQYGVQTTVLYERVDDDYTARSIGLSDDELVGELRKGGLDVLVDTPPAIPDPSLYWIPDEGHPTPLLYKAMARQIEAHLREVDPAALAAP